MDIIPHSTEPSKPLRDKRFPALSVALEQAEIPVSPTIRNLYLEIATRLGEKHALESWHSVRSEQVRNGGPASESLRLRDVLRALDRSDAALIEWEKERNGVNAARGREEESVSPVPPIKSVLSLSDQVIGMCMGLLLAFCVGLIGGLLWSALQGGAGR